MASSTMKRSVGALLAAVLLSVGLGTAVAAPASADTVSVTCTGQENITFNPPLTNASKPETVSIAGDLGSKGDPGLCVAVGTLASSAAYTENFTEPSDSCTAINIDLPGTRTITWDNGQTSTFTFTSQIISLASEVVVVLTGDITAGRFTGDTAAETLQIPNLDPQLCQATGISTDTVQAQLIIAG